MKNKSEKTVPFSELTPDLVLDAIESVGFAVDAKIFPLNSYENRVYQIGLQDGNFIIAKFYRPNRWTKDDILEEHEFSLELAELEIPVIPPVKSESKSGATIFEYKNFVFSLYPRKVGHAPEFSSADFLSRVGQQLGRIHAVGQTKQFTHRPTISVHDYAEQSIHYLIENDFIPVDLQESYSAISFQLLDAVKNRYSTEGLTIRRLHGDCHVGNIIERDESLYFVDLDDARNGPAIQDLWMFLSGSREERLAQLQQLLDGYTKFCDFSVVELELIECLRALRLIHHSAWIARRWTDPAFPRAFPWFNNVRYWSEHILSLKEQLAEINEPHLYYLR